VTPDQELAAMLCRDLGLPEHTITDVAARIRAYGDERARAERSRCESLARSFASAPMDYRGWSPGPAADHRAVSIANGIAALD